VNRRYHQTIIESPIDRARSIGENTDRDVGVDA
jgi:hypothetical protein